MDPLKTVLKVGLALDNLITDAEDVASLAILVEETQNLVQFIITKDKPALEAMWTALAEAYRKNHPLSGS